MLAVFSGALTFTAGARVVATVPRASVHLQFTAEADSLVEELRQDLQRSRLEVEAYRIFVSQSQQGQVDRVSAMHYLNADDPRELQEALEEERKRGRELEEALEQEQQRTSELEEELDELYEEVHETDAALAAALKELDALRREETGRVVPTSIPSPQVAPTSSRPHALS